MSIEAIIRSYRPEDKADVERICADTGFLGEPIDSVFKDRKLFSKIMTAPYLKHDPKSVFVAEVDNKVVGYTLGTTRKDFSLIEKMHRAKDALKLGYNLLTGAYNDHPRSKEYAKWLLFGSHSQRAKTPPIPSSQHINVEKGYRHLGIGKLLFDKAITNYAKNDIPTFYGTGIETPAITKFMHKTGGFIYDCVPTKKFKQELPNTELNHVTYIFHAKDSKKYFAICIHDFTPQFTENLSTIISSLNNRGLTKFNIAITPKYNNDFAHFDEKISSLIDILKNGESEFLLHGYSHTSKKGRYGSLFSLFNGLIRNIHMSEFETIKYDEAVWRIKSGKELLNTYANNMAGNIKGFIPPCWTISKDGIRALKDEGFSYIAQRNKIIDLKTEKILNIPVLEFTASPIINLPSSIHNKILLNRLSSTDLIRVPIHPQDLDNPKVFKSQLDMINDLRAQGRQPITYSEYFSRKK